MDLDSLAWQRLGRVDTPTEGYPYRTGLVGYGGGYVVFGESDGGPWISFSADARVWTVRRFDSETECDEPAARFDVGATNGQTVLILGTAREAVGDSCGIGRLAAWRSDDGLDWTAARADNFTFPPGYTYPKSIWWSGTGWSSDVARSVNGLDWQATDYPLSDEIVAGFGAPDGTEVLYTFSGETSDGFPRVILYARAGGDAWRELELPARCARSQTIVPPSWLGPDLWVVFGQERPVTCVSSDLEHWSFGKLDVPAGCNIRHTVTTRLGIIATYDVTNLGDQCDPQQWVTRDGISWTRIKSFPQPMYDIADGPAGVIGVRGYTDAAGTVWLLEP